MVFHSRWFALPLVSDDPFHHPAIHQPFFCHDLENSQVLSVVMYASYIFMPICIRGLSVHYCLCFSVSAMKAFATQRRNSGIELDGFQYTQNKNTTDTIYWRCRYRDCSGRGTTRITNPGKGTTTITVKSSDRRGTTGSPVKQISIESFRKTRPHDYCNKVS